MRSGNDGRLVFVEKQGPTAAARVPAPGDDAERQQHDQIFTVEPGWACTTICEVSLDQLSSFISILLCRNLLAIWKFSL
jgi:hypothetical protein